ADEGQGDKKQAYVSASQKKSGHSNSDAAAQQPPFRPRMIRESRWRRRRQVPSELAEQQPHRQLHAANDRLWEYFRDAVEQSGTAENDKYAAHEEGPGGDFRGAETLGDGNRA